MKRAEIKDGVIVNIAVVGDDVPEFMADWPEVTHEGIGWVLSGKAFVEPITLEPLNTTKERAEGELLTALNAVADRATAGYLRMEVASWPAKAADARAIVAGGAVSNLIAAEAAMLGVAPEILAAKIVAKATSYEQLIAALGALRQTHTQAISAATTAKAVNKSLAAAHAAIAAL